MSSIPGWMIVMGSVALVFSIIALAMREKKRAG